MAEATSKSSTGAKKAAVTKKEESVKVAPKTTHSKPATKRVGVIPNGRKMGFNGQVDGRNIPDAHMPTEVITGVLDVSSDGHGILRPRFSASDFDAYISSSQIRRFRLRPGDVISGPARRPKENERYWGLLKVDKVVLPTLLQ